VSPRNRFVFSTKERRSLITPETENVLYPYMGGTIRNEGGILIGAGGTADHVHLLVRLKATVAPADFLRVVKANSSKRLNKERTALHKFGWQDGYAAFTVSQSQVPRVRTYIANQKNHHRRVDFKEELRGLLRKHGIEFDEQYLWD
jgi:putative transposase